MLDDLNGEVLRPEAVERLQRWIMGLPPFAVPQACVKCGAAKHHAKYHHFMQVQLDYLGWTCETCGYSHATRCQDAGTG